MDSYDPRPVTNRSKLKTKYSSGIVLIRFSQAFKQHEILMIKKRYTHAFYSLILEKTTRTQEQKVKQLLNKTTLEEKLVLGQLNFDKAYNLVWNGTILDRAYYDYYRKQFYREWVEPDGGKKLLSWLKNSQNAHLKWGVPKGRKSNFTEKSIDCAIREFREETNIPLHLYRLIPTCKRTQSIIDDGVAYRSTYYLALTRASIVPRVNLTNRYQIDEIKDIAWIPVNEIQFQKIYKEVIKPMIRYARRYLIT